MQRVSWENISADSGFYINVYDAQGGYAYPLHDHENHWEYVYVSSGSFLHRINGAKTTQRAGELVLVRDRDAHSLRGKGFSYVNLAFDPVWIDRIAELAGMAGLRARLEAAPEPPRAAAAPEERARLEGLMAAAARAETEGRAALRFAKLQIELLELLERGGAVLEGGGSAADIPEWLRDLDAWARREGGRGGLDALRAKSGYSREHVCRAMKRCMGLTPTEYLERIRLERARELLRSTNYSVLKIAQETGWNSLRHFQRRFTAAEGCPPGAYRSRTARFAHPAKNRPLGGDPML